MPSHDSALEEIKSRLDIVDLVSDYVNLKQAGQNWKGLCPFHTEKTPSFTVSPAKQIYHCFGCGSGGDIFSFLVKYENMSFPEAVRVLAKRAGVTLRHSRRDAAASGVKETLLNMHRDTLAFFQHHLTKNSRAQKYLTDRGLDIEARKLFALGYAPGTWDGLLSYLKRKGYKAEALKASGLITQGSKGPYDTFRSRIMFPIYDLKGDVIAFGGRSMDSSEPKYLNSPETPIFSKRRVLYGLYRAKDTIKDAGYALFMEGYMDVITAHLHGFSSAVAPLGTALSPEHGKLIKRFVDNAVVVFDSDPAGMTAAKKAAGVLLESGMDVKVISFPGKEDPDGFLRKKGNAAFEEMLQHPLSIVDFFMDQKGDRRKFTRELIETIHKVSDRVLQGYYVKMLSEKLRINEFFIIEELKRIGSKSRPHSNKNAAEKRPGSRPLDEIYIIKLLLQMPDKVKEVSDMVSPDKFRDSTARAIFMKMQEGLTALDDLLPALEGPEKDLLVEISFHNDFEEPDKALADCMKRFEKNRRKILLQQLQLKIKDAEQKKDYPLLKQLQKEQHSLLKS